MIIEEHKHCNIVGMPGNYAVKAHGNNRIMVRDLKTIEEAREWIKVYG
jgi:formylmethanofuran dehydrogenase subunit A